MDWTLQCLCMISIWKQKLSAYSTVANCLLQLTLLHKCAAWYVYVFLFSGNRFFYLGDKQVVLVFNCAHLCIICNLEQCLSLVLQIKDCTQSKVEEYMSAVVSIPLCHSQSGACPAPGLFSKILCYFCELKTWSNVRQNKTSTGNGVLQTLKLFQVKRPVVSFPKIFPLLRLA